MAASGNPEPGRWRSACAVVLVVELAACGPSPATPATDPPAAAETESGSAVPRLAGNGDGAERRGAESSRPSDILNSLPGALGRGGPPLPGDLELGGDCPVAGTGADEEIAAQATGRVPLRVGLTLTDVWRPNPDEEYECLLQVTAVNRDSIDATLDCNHPSQRPPVRRRLCRVDLDNARMLMTGTGLMTVIDASGKDVPETAVGATWFSLSRGEFAELKRKGSVQHRYVQPSAAGTRLDVEATATLRNDGAGTARVAINDSIVDVPVIRASGESSRWHQGRTERGQVKAVILDDERLPLLVDYVHVTGKDPQPVFRLSYGKITFPGASGERADGRGRMLAGGGREGAGDLEQRLTEERRVDVYGVYFDFNSDRIRQESEPILEEIASALSRNPGWTLSIGGHTDNVGGKAYNLDLSRRRSEAVRKALVDRYGIAATRLTAAGHGDVAPKDTNDTPEGRARNRRVELIRR